MSRQFVKIVLGLAAFCCFTLEAAASFVPFPNYETRGQLCSHIEKGVTQAKMRPVPHVDLPVASRHFLALQASNLVYKLVDLEMVTNGIDLIAKQHEFVKSIPKGYTIQHHRSDPITGMKYVVLQPTNKGWPWILSFAGTESELDIMSDLSLGIAQLNRLGLLKTFFTHCEITYENYEPFREVNGPLGSQNWIVTGHSLGGGLAQAFAFKTQLRRKEMFLDPARMEVVTFNSFGVDEQIKMNPFSSLVFDLNKIKQQIIKTLPSSHYFVTGDLVSRIGTHIGPTYELFRPMKANSFEDMKQRHLLTTVNALVLKDPRQVFTKARSVVRRPSRMISALAKVGRFFKTLPFKRVDTEYQKLMMLLKIEQAYSILNKSTDCNLEFKSTTVILSSMTETIAIDLRARNLTPTKAVMKKLSDVVKVSTNVRACRVGEDLRNVTGMHLPPKPIAKN